MAVSGSHSLVDVVAWEWTLAFMWWVVVIPIW